MEKNVANNPQVYNSRREQYKNIKYGRSWYLLLFRCNDTFVAYEDDAETLSKVLGLNITQYFGMKCAGFPERALSQHLPKLREHNEYISICDDLCHNREYSRRTLTDILRRNSTPDALEYYGECTDVFTSSDDREQANVKADGYGVMRYIYYRIDCPDYQADNDLDAFYKEVTELMTAEGWEVEGDWKGYHCPTMRKGEQRLYCHPQSLSGEVSPEVCDHLADVLRQGKTFRLRGIDDYGRIFLTTSEEDERNLYHNNYSDGLAEVLREMLTTKRSNLYKDKSEALSCTCNRIAIENKRTDLNNSGTNCYESRKAVSDFAANEYDRLFRLGYIQEAEGKNGRKLARWNNRRKMTKVKRENLLF